MEDAPAACVLFVGGLGQRPEAINQQLSNSCKSRPVPAHGGIQLWMLAAMLTIGLVSTSFQKILAFARKTFCRRENELNSCCERKLIGKANQVILGEKQNDLNGPKNIVGMSPWALNVRKDQMNEVAV